MGLGSSRRSESVGIDPTQLLRDGPRIFSSQFTGSGRENQDPADHRPRPAPSPPSRFSQLSVVRVLFILAPQHSDQLPPLPQPSPDSPPLRTRLSRIESVLPICPATPLDALGSSQVSALAPCKRQRPCGVAGARQLVPRRSTATTGRESLLGVEEGAESSSSATALSFPLFL
jgi:hypothetical protein